MVGDPLALMSLHPGVHAKAKEDESTVPLLPMESCQVRQED